MIRSVCFLLALGLLAPLTASAQSAEDRRPPAQIADSIEIARLAHELTDGVKTDSARAARLYEWVARNLTYDVDGFLRGRLSDGKAETVFRKRKAVCGGYVALYERLAREAGLVVMPILGYAKGFTYRPGASTKKPNHSWLAVSIDGEWRFVDPTWASGFINGRAFEPRFNWDYFLIDPQELILSHFPEESEWQLLDRPMSRREFERMPLVPRHIVNAGFDATTIRALAAKGVRTFPSVTSRRDVRIVAAPLSGTLSRAAHVNVDIQWAAGDDVALVSGGIWRHLERVGDHFRGETVAAETHVALVGKPRGSEKFETLLYYQVQ